MRARETLQVPPKRESKAFSKFSLSHHKHPTLLVFVSRKSTTSTDFCKFLSQYPYILLHLSHSLSSRAFFHPKSSNLHLLRFLHTIFPLFFHQTLQSVNAFNISKQNELFFSPEMQKLFFHFDSSTTSTSKNHPETN